CGGGDRRADSEGGGDRGGTETDRYELCRVPSSAGGEHLGVRLLYRRLALPETVLCLVRYRAGEPGGAARRDHDESGRAVGDSAGTQPADAARRRGGSTAISRPRSRQQVLARV